ncbi:hypothetical protein ACF064_34570 [Streptomyces sp. NPDC015492]|uniref:hypothetical protein n=1 Tax=Streptomyces sp. NPDC015492 TaxID=3364958 RepID=UPI003701286B
MELTRKIHMDPGKAELWFDRAMVNAELKRRGGAVRDMAHALQLDPSLAGRAARKFSQYAGDPFVVDVLAPGGLAGRIACLLHAGEFEKAQLQAAAAISTATGDPNLLFLASQAAAALDDHEKVLFFAERCIAMDSQFTDAYFNLAHAQESLELHDKAISTYRAALALEDDHSSSIFNLILLLRRLGRHLDALEVEAVALTALPWLLVLRYKHAETLAILGRPEEALRQLEEIVMQDPGASGDIAENRHFARYISSPDWQSVIHCDHTI